MRTLMALCLKSARLRSLTILGLGLGIVLLGALALVHTVKAERSAFRFSVADEENQAVAQRLQHIERTMAKLNAYSEVIADLNRAALASGRASVPFKMNQIEQLMTKHASLSAERQESRLGDRVEDLATQMVDLESQLDALMILMQGRAEILTSLPTITPTTGVMSSHFGTRQSPFSGEAVKHLGVDIGAAEGTPVVATADGLVVSVSSSESYGKMVIIDHGFGVKTRYAHNSKVLVKKGQQVRRGQKISKVGSTGRSTGPHLHYEVIVDRKAKNPEAFLVDLALDKIEMPTDLAFARNIGGAEATSKKIKTSSPKNRGFMAKMKSELKSNSRFWLGAGMISFAASLLIFMLLAAFSQKRRKQNRVKAMLSDVYEDMAENSKEETVLAA